MIIGCKNVQIPLGWRSWRRRLCSLFAFAVQVVFVSTCRSFWDCGSVALDDITVSLGDCELTAGKNIQRGHRTVPPTTDLMTRFTVTTKCYLTFIFLLQVCCRRLSQDTVTSKPACVVTLRTSRSMVLTGSGGEDPPRPRTPGQEETTQRDSVRAPLLQLSFPCKKLKSPQSSKRAWVKVCNRTNRWLLIDRILPAHGGVAHAARSECAAAVPPSEGLQGAPVSALLLPHVRLRHGPAQRSPRQGRRGRVAVATERRAEHRLAEGHSEVPEWQPASGKSPATSLLTVLCGTCVTLTERQSGHWLIHFTKPF